MESGAAGDIPQWRTEGDWFDVCSATSPALVSSRRPRPDNWCQGVLAWYIREGYYGDVQLDGLNLIAVGEFEGNIWGGETKVVMGMFMDERADESQREALQMIFGGQAGGFPANTPSSSGRSRARTGTRRRFPGQRRKQHGAEHQRIHLLGYGEMAQA